MPFLYSKVQAFWKPRLNAGLKMLLVPILLIVISQNFKGSHCILNSTKEGYNNRCKNATTCLFNESRRPTHFNNGTTNGTGSQPIATKTGFKVSNSLKRLHKPCCLDQGCFISTHSKLITSSPSNALNIAINGGGNALKSVLDPYAPAHDNDSTSSSVTTATAEVPVGPITSEDAQTPLVKVNSTLKEQNDSSSKSRPKLPSHSLSDIDIGLVKNLDSATDVKSCFDLLYGADSGQAYSSYRDNLVKFLAQELTAGGYGNTFNLLYNRWSHLDTVALSRGFRVLLTEHFIKRKLTKVVETLVRLLPAEFAADIHSFDIAAQAITRTYVDGWVLSLLLVSIVRSYPVGFFKTPFVFTDFKVAITPDIFKDASSTFSRKFPKDLQDTLCSRSTALDSFFNGAIYACFNSRNFEILTSLHYEKLQANSGFASQGHFNYTISKDRTERILTGAENLNDNKGPLGFDDLIDRSLAILSEGRVNYDFNTIQKEIYALRSTDLSDLEDPDWSIHLVLKHALSNLFSTREIVIDTRGSEPSQQDDSPDLPSQSTSPSNLLRSVLETRRNLDPVLDYNRDLFRLLSEKTLFKKNLASKTEPAPRRNHSELRQNVDMENQNSLEGTIHHIRKTLASETDFGVADIYRFTRMLLRHNLNGATAFNLLFILAPSLPFSKWAHYHLFATCLEHDFEHENLDSLDELLQYMVKLDCKPDPGLYDRFFKMCNALDKPMLVMKHFKMISENGIGWEELDRYTSRRTIRVCFGMYEQIFLAGLSTGKLKVAMRALKHLMEALHGTYKAIPASTWKVFANVLELSGIEAGIRAIVDQFSSVPEEQGRDAPKPVHLEIPRQKSAITSQIERILDNYINDTG